MNSVRTRLPILERWLRERRPDFLFMQETKTEDKNFPEAAFTELGYRSFYRGEKTYNGVAALVKNGLNVEVSYGFADGEYTTRVQTLSLNDLVILNTYVPQGRELSSPSYVEKKEFFARVCEVVEREKSGKFLWLGDLNVAPENIDVTHPEQKKNHVCFTKEIRAVFSRTREGLTDLLRKFDSSPGVYTFYDYRVKNAFERKIGWRIDHMLASESLAELCSACYPDTEPRTWKRPSDHVPLVGEFIV